MTKISRRGFARIISAGAAYAAFNPATVLPGSAKPFSNLPPSFSEGVRLSSNENPRGPSPAAIKAMTNAFNLAWRYPDEHADMLTEQLAKLHGVSEQQIVLGNGSGEILKLCAAAFTDDKRKLVVADPTFEAIGRHAITAGAQVVRIKLTSDYRHDLPAMLTAADEAGVVYICNPNNPTASLTPKEEIRSFLSKLPRRTMVLIDEAYHHYVDSPDYESAIPLVKSHPNLSVARTFSKIYGMAGLRCGYCVMQPENVRVLRAHQSWDSVNIMALVAAGASLSDQAHVAQGEQINSEVKKRVCSELDKLGFSYIPSHANFLMIDLRRDAPPVISSLAQRNVHVGRFFPSLPKYMRVTIGTMPQMETFLSRFREVTAQL